MTGILSPLLDLVYEWRGRHSHVFGIKSSAVTRPDLDSASPSRDAAVSSLEHAGERASHPA